MIQTARRHRVGQDNHLIYSHSSNEHATTLCKYKRSRWDIISFILFLTYELQKGAAKIYYNAPI
jgi:hypothetical protein